MACAIVRDLLVKAWRRWDCEFAQNNGQNTQIYWLCDTIWEEMTSFEVKNGQYSRIIYTNQLTRIDYATEMQEWSEEMR